MEPLNPVPATYREALDGLTSKVFLRDQSYKRQQWRANRNGAHSDILDFERMFVRAMRKMDVPVFAHNMVRTSDEQDALYVKGVTKAKGGQSPHNYGCAVDIVHGLHAWDIPKKAWDLFGHVGKEVAHKAGIKIEWGGDWSFYDPAHWELHPWREYATNLKER